MVVFVLWKWKLLIHTHTHTKHRIFYIGTTVINVSAVSIFGVIQGNVVYSYEAPDIWGLDKKQELSVSLQFERENVLNCQKGIKVWIFSKKFKACVRYFLLNFYFSPNDSASKTMKNVFYISFEKLFSFSRYSDFCMSAFLSFFPSQPLL